MKISLVTPAGAGSRSGNRTTADRWARFLRELGHEVLVEEAWGGERTDLMIALHTRRSHPSISRYAAGHPEHPLVVVLTGTDLYRDIGLDPHAPARPPPPPPGDPLRRRPSRAPPRRRPDRDRPLPGYRVRPERPRLHEARHEGGRAAGGRSCGARAAAPREGAGDLPVRRAHPPAAQGEDLFRRLRGGQPARREGPLPLRPGRPIPAFHLAHQDHARRQSPERGVCRSGPGARAGRTPLPLAGRGTPVA